MTSDIFTTRHELVERHDESAAIERTVGALRSGQGSVVVVRGPSGIGKSAVLQSLELCHDEPIVLRARCSELERNFEYGVVRQLFTDFLNSAPESERDRWFVGRAAFVSSLFTGDVSDYVPGDNDPTFKLLHGLYWFVANVAADRPLILAVDDLQWCDAQSRRFLAFLAGRIDALPVILAVAARDSEDGGIERDLRRASNYVELAPLALSEEGIRTLFRREFKREPSADVVIACAEVTGGVPFHVIALFQAINLEPSSSDHHVAAQIRSTGSRDITRLFLDQAERAGTDCLSISRALAILNVAPSLSVLAEVAELSSARTAAACDALAAIGMLAERELSLKYPILTTSVLRSLGPGQREQLHLRAARALYAAAHSAEQIAAHLLESTPEDVPWGVKTLCEAANRSMASGGHRQAVRYLSMARTAADDDRLRCEISAELGRATMLCGEAEKAVTILREVTERARDSSWWPQTVQMLGQALAYSGALDEAADLLQSKARELRPERTRERLDLMLDSYFYLMVTERTGEALAGAEELLDAMEDHASPNTDLLRGALALHGVHRNEPAERMIALARRSHTAMRFPDATAAHRYADAVLALTMCGALDLAEFGADQILRFADEFGDQAGTGIARYLRALIFAHRGRLLEAEAEAVEALAHVEEAVPLARPAVYTLLLEIILEADRIDDARELMGRFPSLTEAFAAGPADTLRIGLAQWAIVEGRDEDALRMLMECGRNLADRGGVGIAQFAWRGMAIEAMRRLGRTGEAAELAKEGLALAEEFGAARPLSAALRSMAHIANRDDRIEFLERAWCVLDGSPHELDRAKAAVRLGIARRRHGDQTTARSTLTRGLELAQRCGAAALAAEATAELRAAGARPRAAYGAGPNSLTASELRVAKLAAEGRANREIAMELYVTIKTIEVHLTSVYRKLGISSRHDLAGALKR